MAVISFDLFKNPTLNGKDVDWTEHKVWKEHNYRNYITYLKSDAWRKKREQRLDINRRLWGGFCEVCGEKKATECHHTTYQNLGCEWLFDIAVVCRSCHKKLDERRAAKQKKLGTTSVKTRCR